MGSRSGQILGVVHLQKASASHFAGSATRISLGAHCSSPAYAISLSESFLSCSSQACQAQLQRNLVPRLGVSSPTLSAFPASTLSFSSPPLALLHNRSAWRSSRLDVASSFQVSFTSAPQTLRELDTEPAAAVMHSLHDSLTVPPDQKLLSEDISVGQDTLSSQQVPLMNEKLTDQAVLELNQQSGKWGIRFDLGTVALWLLAIPVSIPFVLYASVIVFGGEAAIRATAAGALDAAVDAGQHILDHRPLFQLHAASAILYTCATPVQFLPAVRKRFPSFHRASGYTFLLTGSVLAVSGLIMAPMSEFPGFVPASTALAVAWGVSGGVALWMILKGHVQEHRRWMIRAAAAGYSSIMTRPLVNVVHHATGMSYRESMPPTLWLALAISLLIAETYIRKLSRV